MKRAVYAILVVFLALGCSDEAEHDGHLDEAGQAAAFSEAFAQAELLKGDTSSCSGVVVPDQSGFNKRVALTFDDGPNPATTPDIIKTLREHGVPAAFFINGRRVDSDRHREILKDIVDDPSFVLANHTWSHPQMTRLSLDDAEAQIDRNTTVIEEAGGAAKWMRFPFGADVPTEGICVSKAGDLNTYCDDLPGTIDVNADRFIGESSAPAANAEVCLPAPISREEG